MMYGTYGQHLPDEVVPIQIYVQKGPKWETKITEGLYSSCNYKNYTWRWLKEINKMGWAQDNPPAIMHIIASEGMLEIANEILSKNKK